MSCLVFCMVLWYTTGAYRKLTRAVPSLHSQSPALSRRDGSSSLRNLGTFGWISCRVGGVYMRFTSEVGSDVVGLVCAWYLRAQEGSLRYSKRAPRVVEYRKVLYLHYCIGTSNLIRCPIIFHQSHHCRSPVQFHVLSKSPPAVAMKFAGMPHGKPLLSKPGRPVPPRLGSIAA